MYHRVSEKIHKSNDIRMVMTNLLLITMSVSSLMRIIIPEFYIFSVVALSIILITSRSKTIIILIITEIYVLIAIAWALASNFSTLPRDDPYHYFRFTKYIYQTKHFYINETSEKIFLANIAPWPLWEEFLVILADVYSVDPFIITQVTQGMTTAPLTILLSIMFAKLIFCKEEVRGNKLYLWSSLFIPFLSFFVFANTNPVSRSYALVLYILAFYLIIKTMVVKYYLYENIVLLMMILFTLALSHPYYCVAIPIILTFLGLQIILISKYKVVKLEKILDFRYFIMVTLVSIISSTIWIIYNTFEIRKFIVMAIDTLMSFRWYYDIFGIRKSSSWLETQYIEVKFFKEHLLEKLLYWIVWLTDFIPILLAAIEIIILITKIKKQEKIDNVQALLFLLSISLAALFLLSGASSHGEIAGYSIPLIYVSVSGLAMNVLKRMQTKISTIIMLTSILYIISATLSLGTRTYQAAFIWSSNISFEDKGMHSKYLTAVMQFYNKYFNPIFKYVLTDDYIVNCFTDALNPITYVFSWNFMLERGDVLFISVRYLKPLYWDINPWYGKDILGMIDKFHQFLKMSNLIYNDGNGKIYYIKI